MFEVVLDKDANERCEIWRRGGEMTSRDRNSAHRFIFRPQQGRGLSSTLGRWYRLYEQVRPALDLFGGHIQEGNNFSPARFLGLYTAMEAYCRGLSNIDLAVPHFVGACLDRARELHDSIAAADLPGAPRTRAALDVIRQLTRTKPHIQSAGMSKSDSRSDIIFAVCQLCAPWSSASRKPRCGSTRSVSTSCPLSAPAVSDRWQ